MRQGHWRAASCRATPSDSLHCMPREDRQMKRTYGLFFCFLFAIDRLTKIIAFLVFPNASLLNQKAFFFFAHSGQSLIIFSIFVLILSWWSLREASRAPRISFMASGAALMTAGAWSNFFDVLRYGGIIDWIVLPGLTVFNLADVFIVIGCALVLFSLFREKKI